MVSEQASERDARTVEQYERMVVASRILILDLLCLRLSVCYTG